MDGMIFKFNIDVQKLVEVMIYLAERMNNPDRGRISKVLYFAEKIHLNKYSLPILGDKFVAMKRGPVPSTMYDIMRGEFKLSEKAFELDDSYIIPVRKADLQFLSGSNIECLNASLGQYGDKSFNELSDLSHDKAWHSARLRKANSFLNYEDMFDDPLKSADEITYLREISSTVRL